jgi:hypothetical protein
MRTSLTDEQEKALREALADHAAAPAETTAPADTTAPTGGATS